MRALLSLLLLASLAWSQAAAAMCPMTAPSTETAGHGAHGHAQAPHEHAPRHHRDDRSAPAQHAPAACAVAPGCAAPALPPRPAAPATVSSLSAHPLPVDGGAYLSRHPGTDPPPPRLPLG